MGWNEANISSVIEGGMDNESLVIILEVELLKSIKNLIFSRCNYFIV